MDRWRQCATMPGPQKLDPPRGYRLRLSILLPLDLVFRLLEYEGLCRQILAVHHEVEMRAAGSCPNSRLSVADKFLEGSIHFRRVPGVIASEVGVEHADRQAIELG